MLCSQALVLLISTTIISNSEGYNACASRQYQYDSFVCVCNMTYCDTLPACTQMAPGYVQVYESSQDKSRFDRTVININSYNSYPSEDVVSISVSSSRRYQSIIGFGGAFTDAAGINIKSLNKKLQNEIISSYFSKYGSEYNVGRIPMASCDFSTHFYSYDDYPGDFNLNYFKLAEEDFLYKIPFIRQAMSMAKEELLFFGSPWSAPYWMKTNQNMTGQGILIPKEKYYVAWSNYFIRFIESYKENGISLWGLTVENEPANGYSPNFPFQCMGFTDEMEGNFVRDYLGPILKRAGYGLPKVQLMIMDDQRVFLPKFADVVLNNQGCNQFVSGVAFHWYLNGVSPSSVLDTVKRNHPDKFILATEACRGASEKNPVELGSWERGESYAKDIIDDLLHSTSGWIDWNLALNEQGGPNLVGNFVDSTIIVNASAQEFYKQPMYYTLAHFSKLTPRNSVRIDSVISNTTQDINAVAFLRPDGGRVLHVLNKETSSISVQIAMDDGNSVNYVIPAKALQSYVWWPQYY